MTEYTIEGFDEITAGTVENLAEDFCSKIFEDNALISGYDYEINDNTLTVEYDDIGCNRAYLKFEIIENDIIDLDAEDAAELRDFHRNCI
jgi:hypothetical protein